MDESVSRESLSVGLSEWFSDVLAFHKKFGCAIGEHPGIPESLKEKRLRETLLTEEFEELIEALGPRAYDLSLVAKELVDMIYVVIGTAITWGIDLRPVWTAVHESNMAKAVGGDRADGKVMKPEGWKAPGIGAALTMGAMNETSGRSDVIRRANLRVINNERRFNERVRAIEKDKEVVEEERDRLKKILRMVAMHLPASLMDSEAVNPPPPQPDRELPVSPMALSDMMKVRNAIKKKADGTIH